ncbi:DUF6069 family protein [Actinopolymorpha pittospori]|uniref:Uncharacterized protein n=1 Tax=Actinopolymorpha pittospori TaxID=648752 RepID=A0A927N5W8_9ACTN|nr:DUF6069 family protein [Actinopolymorpha pittospori]MBE1612684.1 hypothetical protein [Actinopolymorpha pittospori]
MTEHRRPSLTTQHDRAPVVDAGRLWAGGVATALVSALVVVVGLVVVRAFAHISVVPPLSGAELGESTTLAYAVTAAVAAVAATGLLHVLLIAAPRPLLFFSWIVALTTVVGVVVPFLASANLTSELVTGAINLVVGIAVLSLLNGVGHGASSRR